MRLLEGKIAVITGGTRGLGFGIAKAYAEEGAHVVVASRSQQAVDAAISQLHGLPGRVIGKTVDVTDLSSVQALADYAIQQFDHIDIWVNNAGTAGPYGPTLDLAPAAFTQVINTNITGVYYGSHIAMRLFTKQHSGKLINLLGHGYKGPVIWQNAYSASKAWVRSFTAALAEETKGQGVGVFAFNPGMVLTDLLTDVEVIEGSEHRLKNFPTVVRMWAKPPEVPAHKAAWLASSATDGKTGMLVSLFSAKMMLSGALKEVWRKWRHLPSSVDDVTMRVIPPAIQP
jgi:glucose 1-dehydrogenase